MAKKLSALCPECKNLVDDRHCENPKANCVWLRCLLCKITFRARDGKVLLLASKDAP